MSRHAVRLSVGLAVVALLSTLLAAPAEAQYSRAGLEGKSLAQFGYGFVSGATDWFVSILYRVAPQWDIAAGFESLTATGGSASSFTFGGRYHFLSEPEKFDPYLFGGLGSISVAVTGLGTASATGVSFGVGSNVTLSDAAEGFGNIGVVSIAGTSTTVYGVGLRYYLGGMRAMGGMQSQYYLTGGVTGGSGGSSTFWVGFGERF